jgi:hypothetical protein
LSLSSDGRTALYSIRKNTQNLWLMEGILPPR